MRSVCDPWDPFISGILFPHEYFGRGARTLSRFFLGQTSKVSIFPRAGASSLGVLLRKKTGAPNF